MLQWVLIIPLISILQGCYPDKIDYLDEYDLAATVYDEEVDFTEFMTYTVVDTIMHMTEDGKDDPNFSREYDAYILNLIRQNMTSRGYQEIPDADSINPSDLIIFVEALSSDYTQYWGYYSNYWGYYGGWWGGYYPGFGYPGYGYPWYPYYPWYGPGYTTSYSTGTLMIEMFDTNSFDSEERTLDGVWMGSVDGILSGKSSSAKQRLEKQINQLFIQSEYLQK